MDRICVQCGKRFTLSESELDFYTSKNLTIPKRCRECRKRNKDIGISPNNPELWSHSDVNRYNRYYVNQSHPVHLPGWDFYIALQISVYRAV